MLVDGLSSKLVEAAEVCVGSPQRVSVCGQLARFFPRV